MEISHPADWELAVASGPERPGECVFADRHFQRLAVKWKRFTYKPNLDLLVEKFRHKLDSTPEADLETIEDLPSVWKGVLQTTAKGHITQVMGFFSQRRLLVEAALVWPGRRDVALEREILSGTAPAQADGLEAHWSAMGLDVTLDGAFQLTKSSNQVGRIHWEFDADERQFGPLLIERLSITGGWLKSPLATWLAHGLPPNSITLHQRQINVNGHPAQELVSQANIGKLASWLGMWRVRIDLAWQCPIEGRLYRVSYSKRSRGQDIQLPSSLKIRCCQTHQPVVTSGSGHTGGQKARRIREPGKSTALFLQSVPYTNEEMELTRNPDNTATAAIPLTRPRYLVPPISWILPFGPYRRVELDSVGLSVLRLCDGRNNVEKIIEIFATDNKLTFREAQLPVTQFLRQLTQRGVIAIVGRDKN